jgi:hypothetical protein
MKIISVWTAHTTENEYGRNGVLVGVYSTVVEATKAAAGRGWWGGEGNVTKRYAIVDSADGKVYLIDQNHNLSIPLGVNIIEWENDVKKSALKKLTPEEKSLLGLRDMEVV